MTLPTEIPDVIGEDPRTGRVVRLLSDFTPEEQAEFKRLAALPRPPPRWKRFELCQLISRAYYEWYAERGIDYRTLREPIPDWMKERVLERDGSVCQLCGSAVERADLHFDHIVPVALCGPTEVKNLQVTHAACNLAKGARG